MGREFELKYRATPQIHQAVCQEIGGFQKIEMETTYFDTADGLLAAQKITLRLRKENGISVCTLKTPLSDGSSGEWECHAQDILSGLTKLRELGAPQISQALNPQQLRSVCGARFVRLVTRIPTADGTAELALDSGVLLGGGKEMPLCELELELKTGSDQATQAVADRLAAQYQLQTEPHSKFRRAQRLASGE